MPAYILRKKSHQFAVIFIFCQIKYRFMRENNYFFISCQSDIHGKPFKLCFVWFIDHGSVFNPVGVQYNIMNTAALERIVFGSECFMEYLIRIFLLLVNFVVSYREVCIFSVCTYRIGDFFHPTHCCFVINIFYTCPHITVTHYKIWVYHIYFFRKA